MCEDKKVARLLQKLMALAASDNPHEAASAKEKARKLMEKHGITLDSIKPDNAEIEQHTFSNPEGYTKVPIWYGTLYAGLAKAFGGYMLSSNGYGNRKAEFLIFSKDPGIFERIDYTVSCVRRTMEARLRQLIKEGYGINTRKDKNSFRVGYVQGFLERYEKVIDEVAPGTGLRVQTESERAQALALEKHRTRSRSANVHAEAFAHGIEEGSRATINEGLRTDIKENGVRLLN